MRPLPNTKEVYIVETSGVNQHGKPWTDQDRFRQKKHAEMWLAAISKPRA